VSDLKDHNCLGYTLSRALGSDRWSFGIDGAVTVPVSGNLRVNNGDALVAAAIAGQGLIYQPTFLVNGEIRAGRLVSVTLDHPAIDVAGVFALYPADRRPPAKVRTFIDFLAQRFGSVPPWD
jgi:DNA-binding transcriptional LysR family regulator